MKPLFTFAIAVTLLPTPSHPHDWYPTACCHAVHCFQLDRSQWEETPAGYLIKKTGEILPRSAARRYPWDDKTARWSPDGEMHICTWSGAARFSQADKVRPPSVVQPDNNVTLLENIKCFWPPLGGV